MAARTWQEARRRLQANAASLAWDHDLHLYMKRSQFDRVSYGDAAYHRARLAGLLRSRLARGSGVF